ncbi:Imm70 family immunity protein [Bacillus sp. C1]
MIYVFYSPSYLPTTLSITHVHFRPPYEDKIPEDITNLAEYHTTERGKIFLDLLESALKDSMEEKQDVTIEKIGR